MIYIQRQYKANGWHKPVTAVDDYPHMKLEWGLDYADNILCDMIPIIYLKEKGSRDLIEMRLIENQVIISYILDLFDFEKEFE